MPDLSTIKEKLYITNEYGLEHQDPNAELDPQDVAWLKDKYGIRTDWHPTCINCQARQMIKYAGTRDKNDKLVTNFQVPCNGIVAKLPKGSSQILRRLVTEKGLSEDRALLSLKATVDPVAWAELMFGFDDTKPRWHLRSYQKEQLRCSAQNIVIREGRRSGKALPLDTPIPTPYGWKTMGGLAEGDLVFDELGAPTLVTFVTETMYDRNCYEVSFDDGTTMVTDAEHQWTVSSRSSRRRFNQNRLESEFITLETEDMINHIKIGKKKPEHNYRIVLTSPIQYEAGKALPVNPYVLGYWLGDGVRNTGRITIGLEDLDESSARIKGLGYKMRIGGHSPIDHNVYGLMSDLKLLGVCSEKRIPTVYLRADINSRMQILWGLMDSDGSVDKQGHCEYSSSDPLLAADVYELMVGLGLKVTKTVGPSFLNGVRHKDRTRLYVNTYKPMFSLQRKLERQMKPGRLLREYRAIVDIQPVPSVPVRCISVDSPRHLYLAGPQCVPTHNTFISALKLLYLALNKRIVSGYDENGEPVIDGPTIMIVTPYQSQILNIFDEMEKLLKKNTDLQRRIITKNGGSLYVKTPFFHMDIKIGDKGTAHIKGFVSGVGNKIDGSGGGTMRGQNATIIYLDEMDMIPDEVLDKVVMPILLTDQEGDVTLIATSTPIGKRGRFYSWCLESANFKEDHLPSTVLPQWEKMKGMLESENSEESFRAEYMAEFIEGSHGVFKPSYIYDARMDYEYEQTFKAKWWRESAGVVERDKLVICLGIDWNKNAGTEFVVTAYDHITGRYIVCETVNVSASEFSSIRWKEEVIRLNYKWKPDHVYADEGYGHTIIEDLKLLAFQLQAKESKSLREQETAKLVDRLVSFNFSSRIELRSPIDATLIVKSGKDFIVENAVRIFEDRIIWFSVRDDQLKKELENYTVLRRSATTNKPVYGPANTAIGDHRLDALMLSLAGIQLEQGLYSSRSGPLSKPGHVSRSVLRHRRDSSDLESPGAAALEHLQNQQVAAPTAIQILQIMRQGENIGGARARGSRGDQTVAGRSRGREDGSGGKSVREALLERASDYRGYADDTEHLYNSETPSSHVVGPRRGRRTRKPFGRRK